MNADDFDPIASPTTPVADHGEPRFAHPDQEEAAAAKLASYRERRGRRRPNVLVVPMDDVGWGDFGCYGGRAPARG